MPYLQASGEKGDFEGELASCRQAVVRIGREEGRFHRPGEAGPRGLRKALSIR